jgi:hypothetical protein
MPAWLSLVLGAVIAIASVGMAVGLIKGQLKQVSDGQNRTELAVAALMTQTYSLSTTSAVNLAQHAELNRRIDEHAIELGKHDESIRIIRTRTHVHAQKIMELDPSWRPQGGE